MSTNLAAQYPDISQSHRKHLSKREPGDDAPLKLKERTVLHRCFCGLILRQEGLSPADALRVAYERYPDHANR